MRITLFSIAFIFCLATLCFAGDKGYTSQTTRNGHNLTTTYTDRETGQTYGSRGYTTGNTTRTDYRGHSTTSTTNNNNNITTHTYTDKRTGAVTGGSTWKNENTKRSYGTSSPYPYNNN